MQRRAEEDQKTWLYSFLRSLQLLYSQGLSRYLVVAGVEFDRIA